MINTRWTARHEDGTFSTLTRTSPRAYRVAARGDDHSGEIFVDPLGNVLLSTSWCEGSVQGDAHDDGEWPAVEAAWGSAAQSPVVYVRGEWDDPNEP